MILRLILLACLTAFRTARIFFRYKFSSEEKSLIFFDEVRKWNERLLKIIGTRVTVEGTENINPHEKYIFIANHTNYLDIPVLIKAIPDNIHFMYKFSLQKVPILGRALKISPFIPIMRGKDRDAASSIDKAVDSLANSGSIILFPEGTRSKTGKLDVFKRGAFMIASKSQKKIIPVVIIGISKLLPPDKKLTLNSGEVLVIIGKPFAKIPGNRSEMLQAMNELHSFMNEIITKNENYFDI